MSSILADTVNLSTGPTSVTEPNAITDTITLVGPNGELYKITWQNLVIALGDRAAADLANVQLAYTELGKIPAALLPSFPENHKGPWLADNSSPQLSDGSGTDKDYYNVTDANSGTIDEGLGNLAIDGQSIAVGDKIVYSSVTGQWYTISQVANKFDGSSTEDQCATAGDYHRKSAVDDRALSKSADNGMHFDGSGEISFGDQALLEPGANEDFTVAFDCYFASNPTSATYVLTKRSGSPGFYVSFNSSGRLIGYIQDSGGSISSTDDGDSLAGRWHRCVLVFDRSSSLTRYVDTATVYGTADSIAARNGDLASSAVAYLGRAGGGGGHFVGNLKNSAYWNRALSAAEVGRYMVTGEIETPDQFSDDSTSTSGTLTAGRRYRIDTFVAGDDFTNIGAGSNATGVEFVATGTTPTTWTNGSTVRDIGCVMFHALSDADEVNGVAPDSSSNGLNGAITNATLAKQTRGLHINAPSAAADEKLLTVSTAGSVVASIDEDGDAVVQRLNIANIPTSATGLAVNDVWNDSGTLKIVT